MGWINNSLIWWSNDGGTSWNKISDHNRAPLGVSNTRIETSNRMVDGTLRRYFTTSKRSFDLSWSSLPSRNPDPNNPITADGGEGGIWLENWYEQNDQEFLMRLKEGHHNLGGDGEIPVDDPTIEEVVVMITDFSKEIIKRGRVFDLWSLSITLEEV